MPSCAAWGKRSLISTDWDLLKNLWFLLSTQNFFCKTSFKAGTDLDDISGLLTLLPVDEDNAALDRNDPERAEVLQRLLGDDGQLSADRPKGEEREEVEGELVVADDDGALAGERLQLFDVDNRPSLK